MSQFIISLNKYLESVNNKFAVGMRFKMRFEGEETPERRYQVLKFGSLCFFFSKLVIYHHFFHISGSLVP